jgi:AraC-like DNA-binding protein
VAEVLYQPFPLPGQADAHIWRYTPENRRPRHFHLEPELNLIVAGAARFGVGEKVIAVVAGDLLWWPPGQDHVLLEASLDFDLFVIGLTPALSARILGTGYAAAQAGPTRVRLPADALADVRAHCGLPFDQQDKSVVETRIGDLWQAAHAHRRSCSDRHAFTRRALASLIERPELRRDDVAEVARGYPTEVSRHFHRDVGLTLTAYRTRLRLLRFIELVDHTADDGRANLLAAAFAAGFGSYSQCNRVFHQTLGCAPREFFGTEIRDQMRDAFQPFQL